MIWGYAVLLAKVIPKRRITVEAENGYRYLQSGCKDMLQLPVI